MDVEFFHPEFTNIIYPLNKFNNDIGHYQINELYSILRMLLLTNIDIDFIMRQIIKSGYGTYKLNNRLYSVLITDIIPRIINSIEK